MKDLKVTDKLILEGVELLLISRSISHLERLVNPELVSNPFDAPKDIQYKATWQIKNNILFIDEIEFSDGYRYKEEVNSLLKSDSKVADWYSGILIAYGGDPIYYRNGVDPVYEKELIFKIENGVVVDHEVIENEIPF